MRPGKRNASAPTGNRWAFHPLVGLVGQMRAPRSGIMMDKGAIFSDLTRRNALRQANGLPTIDLHSKFRHEVAIAAEREFRALCARHADEREIVRNEVDASRDVAAMTM